MPMPTIPANQYMAAMEICWICFVVNGDPGAAPKRSIQTLVIPYVKMTADSTNSAETGRPLGARFHAQPRLENEPRKRANVTKP